jgi:hypothetical protein
MDGRTELDMTAGGELPGEGRTPGDDEAPDSALGRCQVMIWTTIQRGIQCHRETGHEGRCEPDPGPIAAAALALACPTCCMETGHELWCHEAPATLTMGELRERLVQAIELYGVHESKPVGLLIDRGQAIQPLRYLGVHFLRGQFVFVLETGHEGGHEAKEAAS